MAFQRARHQLGSSIASVVGKTVEMGVFYLGVSMNKIKFKKNSP